MTSAPQTLLSARELLHDHLGIPYLALGVVGDTDHRGGYHCGRDRLDADDDYSVVESSRDRNGLTLDASALDIGEFEVRVAGKAHNLRSFSVWLVAQCKANTPDTRDIREIIYSPDGSTVKRWDRLGRRTTGDGSHRTHTHVSYFRDAIKAGRDQTGAFRRYLTEIGLLEDDMAEAFEYIDGRTEAMAYGRTTIRPGFPGAGSPMWVVQALKALDQKVTALAEAVAGTDEATVAGLKPRFDAIDAALAAEVARDAELRDLLEKHADGQIDAEQVVRRMGELLSAAAPPA